MKKMLSISLLKKERNLIISALNSDVNRCKSALESCQHSKITGMDNHISKLQIKIDELNSILQKFLKENQP